MEKFKKIWSLLAVLLMTVCNITFTACSDDEDNDDEKGLLETPTYESVSAKYTLENNDLGIASIELTASGNYAVIYDDYSNDIAANDCASATRCIMNSSYSQDAMTRGQGGSFYGNFIKISDTEFILEGFGTIVIEGSSSNAYSIKLTPSSGETATIGATKGALMPDSEYTNALCRTWNISTIRMRLIYNGNTRFDRTLPAKDYPQLMKELNAAVISLTGDDNDGEDYFEVPSYGYSQVVFTKSGSYLVTTTDNQLGVSMWKWKNEKEGIIRYTHYLFDYDFVSDYANDATITFSGKQMTMFETNLEEEDEGETFKITTLYTCTEAH